MSNEIQLKTTINGIEYDLTVPARLLASDFLRDNLNLTGTHVGCEHGICGSCTIKIDGLTARSCLKFAVQLDGKKVETVEKVEKLKEENDGVLTFAIDLAGCNNVSIKNVLQKITCFLPGAADSPSGESPRYTAPGLQAI